MDRIYSSAYFTIVAASGKDSEAGLPGVSLVSRESNQLIEEVRNLRLARVLPGRAESIETSKWNSRAWTFQERLQSMRMLIFTAEQVHFSYQSSYDFREDMVGESECALFIQNPVDMSDTIPLSPLFDYEEELNFDVYSRLVSSYTSRKMTNPNDCLAAFNAIEKVLRPVFRIEKAFCAGLPQTAFDAALLWKPVGPSTRRRDPKNGSSSSWSWTWAGWEGAVTYEPISNIGETTVSMLSWCLASDTHSSTFGDVRGPMSSTSCNTWQRLYDGESDIIYYKDNSKNCDVRFARPIPGNQSLDPTLLYLSSFKGRGSLD
ncbi:hypothetical protein MMC10_003513 [Thelotrema lepadinum]|nr:hypothetical protein [Thelotrema lepadinum]